MGEKDANRALSDHGSASRSPVPHLRKSTQDTGERLQQNRRRRWKGSVVLLNISSRDHQLLADAVQSGCPADHPHVRRQTSALRPHDTTHHLMEGITWRSRQRRPVQRRYPLEQRQVAAANAARENLDQDLIGSTLIEIFLRHVNQRKRCGANKLLRPHIHPPCTAGEDRINQFHM